MSADLSILFWFSGCEDNGYSNSRAWPDLTLGRHQLKVFISKQQLVLHMQLPTNTNNDYV